MYRDRGAQSWKRTMERHCIDSQLKEFGMLDRIDAVGPEAIRGAATFRGEKIFSLIEAMAQLGALHVRFLTGFSRHAFLLKIRHCALPSESPAAGPYLIKGEQTGHGENSFAYELAAGRDGKRLIAGEFLFATVDYDERFSRENLVDHYERLFACLRGAAKTV